MCFDRDSRPAIKPIAGGPFDAQEVVLETADGNRFAACVARAAEPTDADIVILPDVRGRHAYCRELALRFAEHGVDAIALGSFGRSAGVEDRGPVFDWQSHVTRTTYDGLRADVTAAAAHLRMTAGVERLLTTGFCMAGRPTFMSAGFGLDLADVIGFYGWPLGPSRNGTSAPAEAAGTFACPALAIFGGADEGIGPEAVLVFETALAAAGVAHHVTTYPNVPHSFFDRKAVDFAHASAGASDEVLGFLGTGAL